MPKNHYQQIRRRFILAVAAVLAVLACLFFWESAREYRLVVSAISFSKTEIVAALMTNLYTHGAIVFLLSVFIVVLSALLLRQLRSLEMAALTSEAQQMELAVKAEMIDSALDAIFLLDEKGCLQQFNNALCSLTGRSRRELETMKIQDVLAPDKADKVEERIQHILSTGRAVFGSEYMHTSGTVVPVEGHAKSVKIGQRQLVLSVVRDISEQKAFEQTLKKVASEWRDTFDSVEDAVWFLDMNRRIIRANKATQAIFGKSPREVVNLHCCEATGATFLLREGCPFENMLKTGKRASVQLLSDHRWFEISIDPVFSAAGVITNAVHIVKDISALKKSELRERVRSEILELIADGEPLTQLLAFIATVVEKESPESHCSIMLVSEDGTRLVTGASPSLPDFYNRAVNRTRIGEGIGSCGTAAFRKERVVVEDINTHPFWKGFAPAREAGLRSCWSEPIISSDGQLLGTFAIYHRHSAILGEEEIRLIEQAAAFSCIALERSRSEAERTALELQLVQSQKMEAIGHLAGGVAHDFNNLLTPIIIYAELLKRALPGEEKYMPKIDGIIKASHKARDLTRQLLSFGRKQPMQMQVVDLNEVISSFYSIMRRTVRASIDINLQLSSQTAIIRADRSMLDQVLLNLVINAQDAIAGTGQVTLGTGQVMIDDEYARLHQGMEAGRYVLLSFMDNGCGMDAETMRHVFEPFFTTKQIGHGTGLGLANVYGIVKQHKGNIAVQSAEGAGTIFSLYFPVVDEKPDGSAPEAGAAVACFGGNETLLLVEDNEMVRTMAVELLESLGYKVFATGHPEQALELIRQHPEKIDLLITDVVMPGMDGLQLFERLNAERPDIDRVLYMSGYTDNVIVTAGVLAEGTGFLPKPFTVDVFIAKIRESLLPVKSSASGSTGGSV